jgi:carbon-monoxide dehydrogenase medium subunit
MKPAPFEYAAPETVEEAVSLLRRYEGEARALAGGQSLVPMLNMRLARPAALVDLNRIRALDYIRETDGVLAIGAMTRQRTIERSGAVRERQPLLFAATQNIGHPQIRNRGTIGGSLAHAHPASEYQAAAVALGARFTIAGPSGTRVVPAEEFFITYLTTSVEHDEILVESEWPATPPGTGCALLEIARRHGDFAIAGVAATVTRGDGGSCAGARIVLFGIGGTAVRARRGEEAMSGATLDDGAFANAAAAAAAEIDEPPSDVHASGAYRRHVAGVLVRRALAEAAARAAA